jgi:hypothetical protein
MNIIRVSICSYRNTRGSLEERFGIQNPKKFGISSSPCQTTTSVSITPHLYSRGLL